MSSTDLNPPLAAATARSILACARHVELDIDGIDLAVADDERLGLLDLEGTPGFLCEPGRTVTRAAREGRRATLTMISGLAAEPGQTPAWQALILRGTLRRVGTEVCECCDLPQEQVVLELDRVDLADDASGRTTVPVEEFTSPSHLLNRGYLQRTAEHARSAHQRELRQAAADLTACHPDLIIGAQLVDLTAWGVTLEWVDPIGSHQHPIWFPRLASTTNDLASLLRACLHPEIC
ncbi:hypothetical protein [Nocardioides sp.]|uniref:hypothetical protein n=1 Tax=Nocardioides sp. TaxID=35761 RepID=UPI002607E98A|nr:hypothetical protein [Nocardioides sp.]